VDVQKGSVTETIRFRYREPWEWIQSLVKDKSLSNVNNLFSSKKYYCNEGEEIWLVDEPWTADDWAAIDASSPLLYTSKC